MTSRTPMQISLFGSGLKIHALFAAISAVLVAALLAAEKMCTLAPLLCHYVF